MIRRCVVHRTSPIPDRLPSRAALEAGSLTRRGLDVNVTTFSEVWRLEWIEGRRDGVPFTRSETRPASGPADLTAPDAQQPGGDA